MNGYSVVMWWIGSPGGTVQHAIEKAAGRRLDGAGTLLSTGVRDGAFYHLSMEEARRIAAAVVVIPGVTVEIREQEPRDADR